MTIGDGTRQLIRFDPGTTRDQALLLAPKLAQRARLAVAEHAPETVEEWFVRWADARSAKGLSSIRNDRARYKKWISPLIGAESIATIPRRRIEEVVQSLDRAVQLGQLRWKTAINVWGVLSKMMKDASRSKVIELRVREDNPAREVQGPDRGVERAGPYLFPSEFLALMECGRVPARWPTGIVLCASCHTIDPVSGRPARRGTFGRCSRLIRGLAQGTPGRSDCGTGRSFVDQAEALAREERIDALLGRHGRFGYHEAFPPPRTRRVPRFARAHPHLALLVCPWDPIAPAKLSEAATRSARREPRRVVAIAVGVQPRASLASALSASARPRAAAAAWARCVRLFIGALLVTACRA